MRAWQRANHPIHCFRAFLTNIVVRRQRFVPIPSIMSDLSDCLTIVVCRRWSYQSRGFLPIFLPPFPVPQVAELRGACCHGDSAKPTTTMPDQKNRLSSFLCRAVTAVDYSPANEKKKKKIAFRWNEEKYPAVSILTIFTVCIAHKTNTAEVRGHRRAPPPRSSTKGRWRLQQLQYNTPKKLVTVDTPLLVDLQNNVRLVQHDPLLEKIYQAHQTPLSNRYHIHRNQNTQRINLAIPLYHFVNTGAR